MEFLLPPHIQNAQGAVRKAGFEIEFAELSLEEAGKIIAELFGGKIRRHNKFYLEVTETTLGDFTLQLDARLLKEKSYEKLWKKIGWEPKEILIGKSTLDTNIENTLDSIASKVIPYEISTPPIPMDSLAVVEQIRMAMLRKKAKGTSSSVFYAFATHINIELPVCNTSTILAYTQAFLLLYPWVSEIVNINFTRKLTTFINPFPEEYIELILDPNYNPNEEAFIHDYYQHNPDRNRPLDLYPVLAYLNKGKIDKLKRIGKVNPRPAFHYRIPNSLIDDPAWSLAKEWNVWVEIERLATAPEVIKELSRKYKTMEEDTIIGFKQKWVRSIKKWIHGKH